MRRNRLRKSCIAKSGKLRLCEVETGDGYEVLHIEDISNGTRYSLTYYYNIDNEVDSVEFKYER